MIRLYYRNDTIMVQISQRQQKILLLMLDRGVKTTSTIQAEIVRGGDIVSLVTIKREIKKMLKKGLLLPRGSGRSRSYEVSTLAKIFINIPARTYCEQEPDKRFGSSHFNFDLFTSFPNNIFSEHELNILNKATTEYYRRTKTLSLTIEKKELERLVIELSWKSSRIEGNTYTLLDTEKLILEHKEALGHDKKEARMILNHKDAFSYIHENKSQFLTLSKRNLQDLHAIITKDLSVEKGFRKHPVGVVGSKYQPLDNVHQIMDAIEKLSFFISSAQTPYVKALVALLGISYIQPFEDGNKRTSRLMANALLMAHNMAPLSYRSVNEQEYRDAILVFYEVNSIIPFKRIFIDQYDFAARNYAVK
ncbi:MAG TPA: cell filamentation protein Fic [Deltaproteobacteria bacterium]|nr:cell filamentation protein Fic [Deltaproteobacteria bacterium]